MIILIRKRVEIMFGVKTSRLDWPRGAMFSINGPETFCLAGSLFVSQLHTRCKISRTSAQQSAHVNISSLKYIKEGFKFGLYFKMAA